jgi:hypothetical protein
MQTIITKYLGPTNTKGARVKAYEAGAPSSSVTIPYNTSLEAREAHTEAARALAANIDAVGVRFIIGYSHDGGYVFVHAGPYKEQVIL